MTNTLTWNIKNLPLQRRNTNPLSVISILVLCAMMFLTIQPVLADADDCLTEHIAVIIARGLVELAAANRDAAQEAIDSAEGLIELAAALAWLASAEWALNQAETAHDQALDDLDECQNPPCPCGCEIEGCDTCEEHASGGCDSCSS